MIIKCYLKLSESVLNNNHEINNNNNQRSVDFKDKNVVMMEDIQRRDPLKIKLGFEKNGEAKRMKSKKAMSKYSKYFNGKKRSYVNHQLRRKNDDVEEDNKQGESQMFLEVDLDVWEDFFSYYIRKIQDDCTCYEFGQKTSEMKQELHKTRLEVDPTKPGAAGMKRCVDGTWRNVIPIMDQEVFEMKQNSHERKQSDSMNQGFDELKLELQETILEIDPTKQGVAEIKHDVDRMQRDFIPMMNQAADSMNEGLSEMNVQERKQSDSINQEFDAIKLEIQETSLKVDPTKQGVARMKREFHGIWHDVIPMNQKQEAVPMNEGVFEMKQDVHERKQRSSFNQGFDEIKLELQETRLEVDPMKQGIAEMKRGVDETWREVSLIMKLEKEPLNEGVFETKQDVHERKQSDSMNQGFDEIKMELQEMGLEIDPTEQGIAEMKRYVDGTWRYVSPVVGVFEMKEYVHEGKQNDSMNQGFDEIKLERQETKLEIDPRKQRVAEMKRDVDGTWRDVSSIMNQEAEIINEGVFEMKQYVHETKQSDPMNKGFDEIKLELHEIGLEIEPTKQGVAGMKQGVAEMKLELYEILSQEISEIKLEVHETKQDFDTMNRRFAEEKLENLSDMVDQKDFIIIKTDVKEHPNCFCDDFVPLWIPPRSPHNLIEESLYNNPWALLIATIFLNKTSCKMARPYLMEFLNDYPDAKSVLKTKPDRFHVYFNKLGLMKRRSEQVWKMSYDYLNKNWKNVKELYGIGKYGEDAYRMFCLGDLSVEPNDRFLKIYKAWYNMKKNRGEFGDEEIKRRIKGS